MTWAKGREMIEDLLHRGHLEQVPANEAEAQHLMTKATSHLTTAATVAGSEDQIHAEDIRADLPAATAIVDAASRILPQLTVFAPRR